MFTAIPWNIYHDENVKKEKKKKKKKWKEEGIRFLIRANSSHKQVHFESRANQSVDPPFTIRNFISISRHAARGRMQRGSIAAVRRFSIRSRRRPNFRWNDSYELIIFTVCQPCCYTVLLRVYYALYRRLVSRPWSLRSWIYYDEIDSSDPSLYRIDIEFEARRFRSNIISSSKQIIGMLKFAWKKDDFYRMRINLSRLGYRKRVVNSSRRKDCQLGDQKRGDYWNSTPRLRLKFLFSMHNVYKSLACLLLIPRAKLFPKPTPRGIPRSFD